MLLYECLLIDRLEESRDKLYQDAPGVAIRLLQVDLADMRSVRRAGDEVAGYKENLDIVIDNAAVVRALARDRKLISDGLALHVDGRRL